MASDRDHQAARLHRQSWSYTRIAEHLGYPERRAAHRGVQRALAVPAAEEAMVRGVRVCEASEQLLDAHRRLFILLELHKPSDPVADCRAWFRIFDALFRVNDQRCRLLGLFVHPWRHDHWWRRDVPPAVWLVLQRQADRLGREASIPLRWRPPKTAQGEPASIVPLRLAPSPVVDVDSLIPASVRRLLDQPAA